MCGKPHAAAASGPWRRPGPLSITFNNDSSLDHRTLEAYRAFREEAAAKGFRHFLEVFDPNAPQTPMPDLARFINDMIVRTLAGVAGKARPLFLKVVYHGPAAMEQLAGYDSRLIVGILGGSSGTTFDAFQQLWEARKRRPRRPVRPDDQQLGAPVDLHRHLAGWPTASWSRERRCVRTTRLAAAEDSPLSQPRGRPAADAASGAYGSSTPSAVPAASSKRPKAGPRLGIPARFLQDDHGGEARLEPGALETHSRLSNAGRWSPPAKNSLSVV